MSYAIEEQRRILGYAGPLLESSMLSSALYARTAAAIGRHGLPLLAAIFISSLVSRILRR
jgi:hypothetical protein